nr:retrovirus-related Pol polyprotein from transposon TNT 1-94 [Tanacetum cinerariifolium]
MYDSWVSRIHLFIKGKKHGRMMFDLIENGPLVYLTVEEDGQTRLKKYSKLTEAQQLQDDCNVQATNIILHGIPLDVYALVNHQDVAKDIWERVKLLMKGTELSYQEPEFPLLDSGLAIPTFQQGEDLIDCINKVMAFLFTVASRFPASNNQLRMSSNPHNQTTIQDRRVTVQQFQGRQTQSSDGARNKEIATTSRGNYAAGQSRVVKCYNCQRERYMARKCTQPKRPRNSAWFKKKLMLIIPQNLAFQTEDLDAYDSDGDDIYSAKAVLMANLSSCVQMSSLGIEAPSELPKVSLVNESLKKLKYHHARFDKVVKKKTTSDAITADTFSAFDKTLQDEITEVQIVFNQMKADVDQCFVDKNTFEIKIKQLNIDNDQLLNQIMSQEIVHIAMNSIDIVDVKNSVVATACYIQNRSLIRKYHNKTPYELLHDRKHDVSYLHVFGALCYLTNDNEDLGPGPKLLTPGTNYSGLVQNVPSLNPYVPPIKNDWEILFQPMFDEYLNPSPYATSISTSQTNQETPSPVIPIGVEEADHDIEVAHMDNNPYVDFLISESSSEESTSHVVIQNHVHSINQPPEHINKWTKDHSIDNVIGDTYKPVSTRNQLQDEALLCYFDAFLSSAEPKSYKEALIESCWIEST